MEEPLADAMISTANVLHWLGQYRMANTFTLLSRLMRVRKVTTLTELQAFVEAEERKEDAPDGTVEAG